MINTGLIEEQVFNSFIDVDPKSLRTKQKDPNQTEQPLEIALRVLDIWSSNDEGEGQIDFWEGKESKVSQPVEQSRRRKKKLNLLN